MTVKTFESEFHDGLYIAFKNYYNFDHIEKVIKKNGIAKLLDQVVGICSIMNLYQINDFEFHLIHHEDIGICLRLPVERDRKQDESKYGKLRKIAEEILTLLKTKKK